MADYGQSSDPSLASYSKLGIQLVPGYIELVETTEPAFDFTSEDIGKIKIKAWRGPDYISDPDTDVAGAGWILAENWWPYQRPTFITPPFAGYISGHSTFSRAAAEVMTTLTGDAYFPGGMGEFKAKKDSFLVFEKGPSIDVVLQWATYRDASDQCSLSRIWGGIHPPVDDIPGRLIGMELGVSAFNFAESYMKGNPSIEENNNSEPVIILYPNPILQGYNATLSIEIFEAAFISIDIFNAVGNEVASAPEKSYSLIGTHKININTNNLTPGVYFIKTIVNEDVNIQKLLIQ
jgi:hypothetical protein